MTEHPNSITNPGTRRLASLVDAIDTEMQGGPEPGVSCDPDAVPDQPPVSRPSPLAPMSIPAGRTILRLAGYL